MASIINATTTNGVVASGDNSGVLQLATNNGTTAVTITTAQRVGIGTTSPTTQLYVTGSGSGTFGVYNDPLIVKGSAFTYVHLLGTDDQAGVIYNRNGSTGWFTGLDNSGRYKFAYMPTMDQSGLTTAKDTGSPSLLLNTNGALLIGTTATSPATADAYGVTINSNTSGNFYAGVIQASSNGSSSLLLNRGSDNGNIALFYRSAVNVGNISVTASATSYNSGSDYRLKNDIQPLTNALQKVALLKPSKWTWKADNTYGDGFVAHELAEVCPHAVTGEKDAMETYTDEDGNEQTRISPQSVDTSFLVATLTAAIQELKAELDATKAEVAALKGAQ